MSPEPLWSSHVLSHARLPSLFSFCLSLFLPTSVCLTPAPSLLAAFLSPSTLSVPYIHLLTPPSAREQKKRTKDNKTLMQMDTPGLSKSKTSQHSRHFHVISKWVPVLCFCSSYILTVPRTGPGLWLLLEQGRDPGTG